MAWQRKQFDEQAFAVDCASGMYTQAELARRHDVSLSLVRKMIAGERRPRVKKLIDEARHVALERAAHKLDGLLDEAVEVLRRLMGSDNDRVALAAAKEVIRLSVDVSAGRSQVRVEVRESERSRRGLSRETWKQVTTELGLPADAGEDGDDSGAFDFLKLSPWTFQRVLFDMRGRRPEKPMVPPKGVRRWTQADAEALAKQEAEACGGGAAAPRPSGPNVSLPPARPVPLARLRQMYDDDSE